VATAASVRREPRLAPIDQDSGGVDPEERVDLLLHTCGRAPKGVRPREAERRLVEYSPNEIECRGGRHWPRELVRQLTHPLAPLLVAAAGLAWIAGIVTVAIATAVVIVINAAFAYVQEMQRRCTASRSMRRGALSAAGDLSPGIRVRAYRSAELA
jgi:magnesium-transporting ATPase (P-type)